MTPNDTQMDVLMRRYAKRSAERSVDTEHLDPDELNAFAQATLPPAARSRYVSHLADCDDCRRLASQLTIAAGAKSELSTAPSDPIGEVSWWQKLKVVLAPASLRYAAFAIVLVAVAGITFVVWRQPRPKTADLVARNEPPAAAPSEALKEPASESGTKQSTQPYGTESKAVAQPTVEFGLSKKESDLTTVSPPPAAKAGSETAETETKSALADSRAVAPARPAAAPSYAPPPPAEIDRAQNRAREQQGIAGVMPRGPQRNESYEKYKVDRARAGESPKDSDEGSGRAMSNQPIRGAAKQEESGPRVSKESRKSAPLSRDANEVREDKIQTLSAKRAGSDEAPPTRSVGGRKFQRHGNAWVDTKFKWSMSVKNISRGSDDYDELDSGLRSIAQQLSGEVIVVWKGKAYRFR